MKTIAFVTGVLLWTHSQCAFADTFGSGGNSFDLEFVTIGSPSNARDTDDGDEVIDGTQRFGAVPYEFRIGKFEISESMIHKANALGGLGITTTSRGPNRPASSITWFEAARFVNWLNTSTGSIPAYKFNGTSFELWAPGDLGFDSNNLYRNSSARYVLPNDDEWYKAAYFHPVTNSYYNFPTGSDSVPDGIDNVGDTTFDAVYQDGAFDGPKDVTNVGVLSPFGTAGQGGNVWEWEESARDLVNNSGNELRVIRGGAWHNNESNLEVAHRAWVSPGGESDDVGFRVVSVGVPEPSSALLAIFVAPFLFRRRRNDTYRVEKRVTRLEG